ncbi:DUF6979 family protein [Limnobaculum xujianqingii]|uniref:DUF6979 family protein n=1 Tax=Limnobaculum xujianqingii TaxID=2738837 RepID=UPI0015BA7314|nr:hypothetical protein [Limnobaculum xujianqingii]
MKKPEDTRYGEIAINALNLIHKNKYTPEKAWDNAVKGYEKGCPKSAFLGLCNQGYILNVVNNKKEEITDNGRYAITAADIIFLYPNTTYTASKLWKAVGEKTARPETHNGQMHVVLALKERDYLQKN